MVEYTHLVKRALNSASGGAFSLKNVLHPRKIGIFGSQTKLWRDLAGFKNLPGLSKT
jgi:hypothetical protein